jgi:hypothetical protein
MKDVSCGGKLIFAIAQHSVSIQPDRKSLKELHFLNLVLECAKGLLGVVLGGCDVVVTQDGG